LRNHAGISAAVRTRLAFVEPKLSHPKERNAQNKIAAKNEQIEAKKHKFPLFPSGDLKANFEEERKKTTGGHRAGQAFVVP